MTIAWAWPILLIAGIFEVCWAIGLKYSEGLTKPIPTIFTIITLFLSMFLLSQATKYLPIGSAYSVWVGVGCMGTAILGILFFQESLSMAKVFYLILILTGIIGLKFNS